MPVPSILAPLCCAVMLAACFGSSMSVAPGVTSTEVETRLVPATQNGEPALVRLPGHRFVVCDISEDDEQFRLRCYGEDLVTHWVSPVLETPDESVLGFDPELMRMKWYYYLDEPSERIWSLVAHEDKVLVTSYRCREGDTAGLIVRAFDATTGNRAFTRQVPFVGALASGDDHIPGVCRIEFSPDHAFAAAYPVDGIGADVPVVILDRELKTVREERVRLAGSGDLVQFQVDIDNEGNLYVVYGRSDSKLRVQEFSPANTAPSVDLPFGFPEIGKNFQVRVEDRHEILVAAPALDPDAEFDGYVFARLDPRNAESLRFARQRISEETLDSLDLRALDPPYLHEIVRSSGPTAYALLIEKRSGMSRSINVDANRDPSNVNAQRVDVPYSVAGPLIVVGCAADGAPRWWRGINKQVYFDRGHFGNSFHGNSLRFNVVAGDTLDIIYRDGGSMILRAIPLSDGGAARTDGDEILGLDGLSLPFTSFTSWLDGRSVLLHSVHGMMTFDFKLSRINY